MEKQMHWNFIWKFSRVLEFFSIERWVGHNVDQKWVSPEMEQ